MATHSSSTERPSPARALYVVLLALAVVVVLIIAARFAFPSGLGIEREPRETAPLEQPATP